MTDTEIFEALQKEMNQDNSFIEDIIDNLPDDVELQKASLEHTISFAKLRAINLFVNLLKTNPSKVEEFLNIVGNTVVMSENKIKTLLKKQEVETIEMIKQAFDKTLKTK